MKDLGDPIYIHRIRIYRDKTKGIIGLSHKLYIEKLSKSFNMENSKRIFLPFTYGHYLSKDTGPKNNKEW